uniref:Transporter n=1 Tax=Solanum tuberosum TaxID=4113 RepID=M1ACC6_SOLTU
MEHTIYFAIGFKSFDTPWSVDSYEWTERSRNAITRTSFTKKTMEWIVQILSEASKTEGKCSQKDHISNWRVTALILTSVLFLASGIWFIGIFLHSVDRFNEENDLQVSVTDRSNTIPLLGETTQSLINL